jgi:hypothetical protein
MEKILNNLGRWSIGIFFIIMVTIFMGVNGKTVMTDIIFRISLMLWWLIAATRIIFVNYKTAYTAYPHWQKSQLQKLIKEKQPGYVSIAFFLCLAITTGYVIILDGIALITTPWSSVDTTQIPDFGVLLNLETYQLALIPCLALILHNVIAHIAESIMAKESPPS